MRPCSVRMSNSTSTRQGRQNLIIIYHFTNMKLPYFKIKDAFDEARASFSYGSGSDKISSTAKLLGKSIANIGMLAVEVGAEAVKKAPETIGKQAQENIEKRSHLMTEEQIQKSQELIEKGKAAKEQRLAQERQKEEDAKQEK